MPHSEVSCLPVGAVQTPVLDTPLLLVQCSGVSCPDEWRDGYAFEGGACQTQHERCNPNPLIISPSAAWRQTAQASFGGAAAAGTAKSRCWGRWSNYHAAQERELLSKRTFPKTQSGSMDEHLAAACLGGLREALRGQGQRWARIMKALCLAAGCEHIAQHPLPHFINCHTVDSIHRPLSQHSSQN